MVERFIGMAGLAAPMSMSMRPLLPLMRFVVVGEGIAAPAIAAAPPSIVVFCTMVTSACTTAEQTANARSVAYQRFMFDPPGRNGFRSVVRLLAAVVMTAAAQLGDVRGFFAVVAAVLAECPVRRDVAGAS